MCTNEQALPDGLLSLLWLFRCIRFLQPYTNLLLIILGFVVIYFGIRATVSFIRFILNVNRDKVFIWENVRLLRWTGWGFLVAILCMSVHDLIVHVPLEKIYQDYSPMSDFTFGVFCLIVAEVFAIGLKLQEEQDLTI